MMALLPIIVFATTDIYEKVKIRRLKCISNDEETDMILIYAECNKNALPLSVYEDNKHFPKKFSVVHNFI
jgi:hypothetical protein